MKTQISNRPAPAGVALILVLALIVVATVIVTAFFFRSRFDAAGSGGYASQMTANKIAELGTADVVGSFLGEMESGVTVVNGSDGKRVFMVDDPAKMMPIVKTIPNKEEDRPDGPYANLIRQSIAGIPNANGLFNVSNVPTYDGSRLSKQNYRPLDSDYWNKPMLTVNDLGDGDAPNWVYVAADGSSPTSAPSDNSIDSSTRVVGRFAFNVYDVGGLIDINAAGFQSSGSDTLAGRKGSMIFADLPGLASEVGATRFDSQAVDNLNDWRYNNIDWSASTDPNNGSNDIYPSKKLQALLRSGPMLASLGKFNPGLSNNNLRPNKNQFLSRLDVIRYLQSQTSLTDDQVRGLMPFLTHYSRDINQPYFLWDWKEGRPAPTGNIIGSDGPAPDQVNAEPWLDDAKMRIRQRFPLERLDLLRLATNGSATGNENLIRRYFGLVREGTGANSRWIYDPVKAGTGIAKPLRSMSELPGDSTDPDDQPNFFEMLYYAISSGSLGQQLGGVAASVQGQPNAPHAYTVGSGDWQKNVDSSTLMHVMRIGAAIIDQWDADPYPTRIEIDGKTVFGVEDLPYLHGIKRMYYFGQGPIYTLHYDATKGYDKAVNVVECAAFLHPQLWNPNSSQSGATTPQAPVKFRFVPYVEKLATNDPPTARWPWGIGSDFNRRPFYPTDWHPPQDSANGCWNFTLLWKTNNQDVKFKKEDIDVLPNQGNWDTPAFNAQLDGTDYVELDMSSTDDPQNALRKPLLLWKNPVDRVGAVGATVSVFQGGILNPWGVNGWKVNSALTRQGADYDTPSVGRQGLRIGKFLCSTTVPNGQTPDGSQQCDLNSSPQQFQDLSVRANFMLEYQAEDGSWRPYDIMYDAVNFESTHGDNFGTQDQVWRVMGKDFDATFRADPRVERFGPQSQAYRVRAANAKDDIANIKNFPANSTGWDDTGRWVFRNVTSGSTPAGVPINGDQEPKFQQGYNFTEHTGVNSGKWPLSAFNSLRDWDWSNLSEFKVFSASAPTELAYRDPDGVMRLPSASEKWSGGTNTVSPQYLPASEPYSSKYDPPRPVILNRPFQSVAEMAYACRDLPWKSIDFWNADSGDTALLDYFCISETDNDMSSAPITAGVINPNSASSIALAALISGTSKEGTKTGGSKMSWGEALDLAKSITQFIHSKDAGAGYLRSRAEIVGSYKPAAGAFTGPFTGQFTATGTSAGTQSDLSTSGAIRSALGNDVTWYDSRRANVLRALTDTSTTRVWNLMIDITAQSGKLPGDNADLDDFVVDGSVRKWVFVSIDRATGRILDQKIESAD